MFAVIYSFKVKPGLESTFERAWNEVTRLIKMHEGGLGAVLHKKCQQHYIAYMQWPDEDTWQLAGKNLPLTSNKIRKFMKDSCNSIETLFKLEVLDGVQDSVIQQH
ncbi:antibiotic biosynthesis monooxygenase [Mangrovimonas sp. AS39]|uniref:antibiotic biosynthesis monooxygenase family protein n=1 Tax=Mangrovimonas futianensis TaxID=2895523 RepID=UPI001E3C2A47|nr:antibiotic biosynthesis monooxygenase [Mangrovimonas futianensis]MCF1191392.1 antibiotic biosynthesis monooxygenase [Mangrovimonas futianensis]MCF1195087.1 antibiotic biosynthesis monooxygenase [Mangrovimonas futianensis]